MPYKHTFTSTPHRVLDSTPPERVLRKTVNQLLIYNYYKKGHSKYKRQVGSTRTISLFPSQCSRVPAQCHTSPLKTDMDRIPFARIIMFLHLSSSPRQLCPSVYRTSNPNTSYKMFFIAFNSLSVCHVTLPGAGATVTVHNVRYSRLCSTSNVISIARCSRQFPECRALQIVKT